MRTPRLIILTSSLVLISLPPLEAQWESRRGNLPDWGIGYALDACSPSIAVVSLSTVGQGGFIWRTTDAGLHWEDLQFPSAMLEHVMDVSMPDSSAIWAASVRGRILRWQASNSLWEEQFRDTNVTEFMNYIRMFDSRNGIAMGDAKTDSMPAVFLKTTDGGANWQSVNHSAFGWFSGDTWRRLDFVNPETGYFYESGFNPQKIYRTTDGCAHWAPVPLPDTLSVMTLRFFDGQIGVAYVGWWRSNAIYGRDLARTNNGGNSWEVIPLPTKQWGNDIEFVPGNASKIWMTDNVKLYYSADTGRTWTERLANGGRDIHFTDPQHGWMLGDADVLYYTAVGGGLTDGVDHGVTELPREFLLHQNYPNPFNPSTIIRFELPHASRVSLKVYNVLGQEVATLVDEEKPTGIHDVQFSAMSLSSGMYVYRLQAGDFVASKKLLVLR